MAKHIALKQRTTYKVGHVCFLLKELIPLGDIFDQFRSGAKLHTYR